MLYGDILHILGFNVNIIQFEAKHRANQNVPFYGYLREWPLLGNNRPLPLSYRDQIECSLTSGSIITV